MKKFHIALPIACAMLLAACDISSVIPGQNNNSAKGDTITRQQASSVLSEAAQKVKSDDFVMPSKFSMTSHIETNMNMGRESGASTVDQQMEYDAEAKVAYAGQSYAVSGNDSAEGMYMWLWTANGHGYRAYSYSLTDFSDGEYEEMSLEDYEEYFALAVSDFVPDKEDLAEAIEDLFESIETLSSISDPSAAAAAEGIEVSVNFTKNSVTEQYNSTGAGNLTASFKCDIAASMAVTQNGETTTGDVTAKGEIKAGLDNYLPVLEDVDYVLDEAVSGQTIHMAVKSHAEYKWGSCNFQAPDITKFPAPSADAE
ncbi:MAG: hypothetical protein J5736_01545 [Bacilli bacterium]|nr:hypothetical protein [Bacilli bacterium]